MKRMLGVAATTAFAMAAIASPVLAIHLESPITADDYAAVRDGWVVICHFDGHASATGTPDFLIDGKGFGCDGAGGNILVINENGLNGHMAIDA